MQNFKNKSNYIGKAFSASDISIFQQDFTGIFRSAKYSDFIIYPNKESYIENAAKVLKFLDVEHDDFYWASSISTDSDYQIHLKRDTRSCFVKL